MGKKINVLYILGNGFDLVHDLPTSYENFHSWLKKNRDKSFIHAFEKLYPDAKDDIGLWRDLESALGNVSLEHAIVFDSTYQECPDEVRNENSSYDTYQCGENLKQVVKVFPSCLYDWTHSIDLSYCKKKYVLDKEACYFSFNYTRTIEDVYRIKTDNIHHVHGNIGGNKKLIVGYKDAQFENDDFEPYMAGMDKELILNILRENRKPVEIIIQEPSFRGFMQNISNVSSVIVFGHSCSDVDKPYFVEIANNIKDNAHWTFYVHESHNNNSVTQYANSIRKEHQTIEITNTSPMEELLK